MFTYVQRTQFSGVQLLCKLEKGRKKLK
jgi:hypothetical protein